MIDQAGISLHAGEDTVITEDHGPQIVVIPDTGEMKSAFMAAPAGDAANSPPRSITH